MMEIDREVKDLLKSWSLNWVIKCKFSLNMQFAYEA